MTPSRVTVTLRATRGPDSGTTMRASAFSSISCTAGPKFALIGPVGFSSSMSIRWL